MTFVSYAQNFEDVMLWRALQHVARGFYVDVGASHPEIDSVSLAFHQRGWKGVHIEPIAVHAAALRAARPGDTVLEVAVSETRESIPLFIIDEGIGITTCVSEIADRHAGAGFKVSQTTVQTARLADILDRYTHGEVHWLKIDVEGLEAEVVRSWSPSQARPWIVVIEGTEPRSQTSNHFEWEDELVRLGYQFVYFDGLNRFYVSAAHPELVAAFGCGPNVFDEFVLSPLSGMVSRQHYESASASLLSRPAGPAPVFQNGVAAGPEPEWAVRALQIMCGPSLRLARRQIVRRPDLRAALLKLLRRYGLLGLLCQVLDTTRPVPSPYPVTVMPSVVPPERLSYTSSLLRIARARSTSIAHH